MGYFFLATILSFLVCRVAIRLSADGHPWRRWLRESLRKAYERDRPTAVAVAALVVALLVTLLVPLLDPLLQRALETAAGFRTISGLIAGFLIATLVERQSRARRGAPEGGEAHRSGGGDDGAFSSGSDAPWWARSAGLIPLALLVLVVFVTIAPRGELTLDFVRSVKTPFVEATFSRNDARLNLEIESEPQGFFRLGRRGLDRAIHMARAEAFYLEVVHGNGDGDGSAPTEPVEEARRVTDALTDALDFMLEVLQPAALCIAQVDDIYRDQAVLSDAVNVWGAALARAVLLASLLDESDLDPASRSADKQEIVEAIKKTLKPPQERVAERRENQSVVLSVTSGEGKEYTTDLCWRKPTDEEDSDAGKDRVFVGNPSAAIETLGEDDLARLLREPAAIHASSLFFLWAGSPGGAKRVLERADTSGRDVYPGIAYLLGFTRRWLREAEDDPLEYLDIWNNAVLAIDRRIERLRADAPDAVRACERHAGFSPVIEAIYPLKNGLPENAARLALAERPARADHPCGGEGALKQACKAGLVLGYLTHFREKVRNHIVFEAARELLTGRMLSREDEIFELALAHADRLEAFVEADGYRAGTCFAQQSIRVAAARPEAEPVAITTLAPENEYALYLDSAGLIRLADGIAHNDDGTIERALQLFRRSLSTGNRHLEPAIRATIVEHREQARGALGLAD